MLVYALNKNINLYTLDFKNNKVSTSSLDNSQSSLGIIYGKENNYYITKGIIYSVSSTGEKIYIQHYHLN